MAVRRGAGLDRAHSLDIHRMEMTNDDLKRLDDLILALSEAMIYASMLRKMYRPSPTPPTPGPCK